MKAPRDLNLKGWWHKAACRGLPLKNVTTEVCARCDIYRECLWSAMTEDDRLDYGMFMRAGLTGHRRDLIWFKKQYHNNKMGAFAEACGKAKELRVSIVRR